MVVLSPSVVLVAGPKTENVLNEKSMQGVSNSAQSKQWHLNLQRRSFVAQILRCYYLTNALTADVGTGSNLSGKPTNRAQEPSHGKF